VALLLAALAALFSASAEAELYKWIDKSGRVHYSDQEWTAASGVWAKASAPASEVVAEVYPA